MRRYFYTDAMKILIDIASIAKRALMAGKDTENGIYETDESGKEHLINSAGYGYDNLCNSFASTMKTLGLNPKDMVLVFDGSGGTQARKSIYPEYKSGRISSPTFYGEYNSMMDRFTQDMLNLGVQTARYDGLEADDLIGWFCEHLKEDQILIWTNDYDLLVLAKHPNVNVYANGNINPKPYGEFPYEFVDVYKATVGDSSDKIPGAKGFGPAAFDKMYKAFGDNGLKVLRHLIQNRQLTSLSEDVATLPQLQKLIDYAPNVEVSLKLATLKTNEVKPSNIIWRHGLCKGSVHPFLQEWAQEIRGVTSSDFEQVFADIRRLAADNNLVSLDIETSTPEESDDWLYTIKGKRGEGVDVFGSELTGISLTLGGNFHRTFYFSVNHKDTDNCSLEQIETVLKFLNPTHRFVIQNVNFELVVLHNTFGWFLRDVDDTKLMISYVDENDSSGLKQNSLRWLGYEQCSYAETVADPVTGRMRKMNELTLHEVLSYGADDTVCTAALYNWYQLHMMLENVWQVYRNVEIDAAYWIAQAFLDGVNIDQVALSKMIARDAAAKVIEESTLNDYLIRQGWAGAIFDEATAETWNTPKWVKYAFNIMTGEVLETAVRKIERLIHEVKQAGCEQLADALLLGDIDNLNRLVRAHFTAKPDFNAGSPKQMQNLMYNVMGLPIRIRNKPTDLMRARGEDGTPSTDDVAINSALHYDLPDENDERRQVLQALLKIKMYNTREGLYYSTYPVLPHWKSKRIHASNNQCSTVTRRFSCSQPNLAQLAKGAGDFRTIFVPHHKDALIVSLDFSAQELRLIAEQSQDPNMLACYTGDNLKDMHSLTAAGIAKMPYEEFKAAIDDEQHPKHKWAKDVRKLAKTVNFASSYGAAAPKMAQTLMVTEEEAQSYLDAKFEAFAGVESWKRKVEEFARENGYAVTMLGARRHLKDITSSNKWEAAKAERQASNFAIQGSGAEMTKLAMGRMWKDDIRNRFDIRFFSPIHDEVVFSIAVKDIPNAVPLIHAAMTAPYANMKVPIESSVSLGFNFGDQHELGDGVHPTADNLNALMGKFLEAKHGDY